MSKARDLADLAKNANDRLDAVASSDGALSNRNKVTNGAMTVWQRGTSTTSSGYLADRFTFSFSGVGVTRSKDTDVPSGQGFSSSLKHLNTSTSTATNAYVASQTHIEAQDIRNSGWDYTNPDSYITISFWAKSSVDGTYFMTLRTYDGSSYEYCSPYTLVANTWKKVEFQVAGNSNLTFDNDNGQGLTIFPFCELGSDYTDSSVMPENSWLAYVGTAQTPDKQSAFMSTSGAAFWYTGVQLEVGDTATPFEHRSYGDELARCYRYYEIIDSSSADLFIPPINTDNSNGYRRGTMFYKAYKRAVPTVTLSWYLSPGTSRGPSGIRQSNTCIFVNGAAQSEYASLYEVVLDAEL